MKQFALFWIMAIIASTFTIESCNTTCDCSPPFDNSKTLYEINKNIVQINTTNVATGLESVFSKSIFDSTGRADICRVFVDSARFYDDKSGYFFIETLDNAWAVAHINHDLIGTSRYDVQDENGKFFIREMIETVTYSAYGFVEYYRYNPATDVNDRKLSFVTSIPSAQWFIGTGFYGDPDLIYYDEYEAQTKVLLEIVSTMSRGLSAILHTFYAGGDAQVEFCRDFIDHIKFYDDGSGYFFITDMDGINIAHGADESIQGTNTYDLQDSQGKYIIRDMIEIAQNDGAGFYEYHWINPGSKVEEQKTVYVMKIAGFDYFIGAGFYN